MVRYGTVDEIPLELIPAGYLVHLGGSLYQRRNLLNILRRERGQGNFHFLCSADHEQDWQPYPVDPYSAICDDPTYIHTYT